MRITRTKDKSFEVSKYLTWLVGLPEAAPQRIAPWLLGIIIAFIAFMFIMPKTGVDVLVTYGPAGRGMYVEGVNPRNPRTALWLFWLIGRLPWKWDYLALMVVSVPLLVLAVRWGKGNYWKTFISFPFLWLIAYGQIDAFIVAGLALAWYSFNRRRYYLMGVGLSYACLIKPQVGVLASIALWWWSENKWKPLVIPCSLIVISLFQWGWDWPISWLGATFKQVNVLEGNWANASLYQWIGMLSYLFWLPIFFIPMEHKQKFRCILAATALSLPYFPAYELLLFLVFPLSPLEWAFSGLPLLGRWGYSAAAVLPAWIILSNTGYWLYNSINQKVLSHRSILVR